LKIKNGMLSLGAIALACVPAFAVVPVVKTVPFTPSNPSNPHTAILGVAIKLGATSSVQGANFAYDWDFGDGSAHATGIVTNKYDVSASHTYSGAVGATWTAVLTITDTNNSDHASANYPVIMEANNLQSRVNIAIDKGLWVLHTSMWRTDSPANTQPVNWGGWDGSGGAGSSSCGNSSICGVNAGGLDATNIQAFEVQNHLENGPASDPYTEDVARGLARIEYFLIPNSPTFGGVKQFAINPANHANRCSNGNVPTGYPTGSQSCSSGTLIQEIPGATSCLAPPCTVAFDQNSNGQLLTIGNDGGPAGYEAGMFMDVLVATQNPAGIAAAGVVAGGGHPGVRGLTYLDLVKDLADGVGYCQNPYDPYSGTSNGYDDGGAWQYGCAVNAAANYNDNSVSQWNAIGLIAGNRGFGTAIQQITKDMNQVWVTWSQDWAGASFNGKTLKGAYGYDEFDDEVWGPFADSPSGMVQLVLDDVGRTAAGAADQRWNMAETFYHDNFCNATGSAYTSPREYTYGMFSFSKAMRLHSPGGVLTPIVNLMDEPAGTNPIDWYSWQAANGDGCDGFAQTLVGRQQADGSWFSHDYYSTQYYFETGWAINILNPSVFVSCVSDLTGKGTAGGRNPARVDLTWTPMPNIDHYNVLRSSTTGGPYSLAGSATVPAYSDKAGLVDMNTYFYVLQPIPVGSTNAVCQSNQASIFVP